ncbi:unnamed protein product [Paramecium primaurelia]|uniref:H-type lectin domain-containing protein n=1 Tax=Paramecium primaurelia TaxID=5886 RepID=A0A8S1KQM4_PARPR|nr:unnamed protein product [Paramecium primaurelia]
MKLIILILIFTSVMGAIFEQGYVSSSTISAHKIYRQDIKFNNNFTEIPKIVLSVIGYHSNYNTLDFFSRVTDITNEGFQLQVISDCEINEIRFNYLATEHKDVQTICNNIEVQKDQIDIKFITAFEEQPQVAAFLTGIHRKNQDDIILEIKSIDKNQVHLTTQSKAESSIGLCLLIGPQDVFNRKELPIMQISQGLPNTYFYGISSLSGITDKGVQLSLNQQYVENSYEIGLTLIEINPKHISKQEEADDNNKLSFDDLVDKFSPVQQQINTDIFQTETKTKINSIQITQEELDSESQINSISFIYPEQQDHQLYIEDEEQNLQSNQVDVQQIMTISESWLQHDLSVVDQSISQSQESLDSNQTQINEGQQFLTNLIKPQDYNTNSIDYEDYQSLNRQPENIVIVDSTQQIVDENDNKIENNQDFEFDNSNQMDSSIKYDIENEIENQIEEQIDSSQQQTVVEDLQQQMVEMQKEMQNLQQNSESTLSSEFDPFKIIEQQQFIVEQQKQLVEQQQQIILQYQRLFEEQIKQLSDKQPTSQMDVQQVDQELKGDTELQENKNEVTKQDSLENKAIQKENLQKKLEKDYVQQNQEDSQTEEKLQQNTQDQKYVLQDIPNLSLEYKNDLEKDLESFDRLKQKKDQIDEQQATKILKEITKDLQFDDKLEDTINQFEDGLNDVLQIKQRNVIESNLNNEFTNIASNKRVEFSNVLNKISNQNLQDVSNQVKNISLEEISEAIFPQEYEMEQAYIDWSMNQGFIKNRNDQVINQELVQQTIMQNQQSQEELQKQIEEFLELDNNDQQFSDPLFDDFHSFFSVNQQVKNNLRKRKVLNV